jgi:hypothetical protein
MHATIKPRSNGIAACRRRPTHLQICLAARKRTQAKLRQLFQASPSSELALVAYHPPAVSHATVHRIQPAFESVHAYRLRPIVHPLQSRFQLLRNQILLLLLGKPSCEQSQTRQSRVGKMSKRTACVVAIRARQKGRKR